MYSTFVYEGVGQWLQEEYFLYREAGVTGICMQVDMLQSEQLKVLLIYKVFLHSLYKVLTEYLYYSDSKDLTSKLSIFQEKDQKISKNIHLNI